MLNESRDIAGKCILVSVFKIANEMKLRAEEAPNLTSVYSGDAAVSHSLSAGPQKNIIFCLNCDFFS